MPEQYALHLFLLNWVLVIADAALGYRMAPLLVGKEGGALTAERVRKLLTVVVALYMFFNCLAYFRGMTGLMVIVTGIVILDVVFQLLFRWKMGKG